MKGSRSPEFKDGMGCKGQGYLRDLGEHRSKGFAIGPASGPLIWTPTYTNFTPYTKLRPIEHTQPESKGPLTRAHGRRVTRGVLGNTREYL